MPVFRLPEEIIFPHPMLAESSGLLAVGGDLSQERLIAAYRNGIFPWYSDGEPILWWFTAPRLVLFPEELHIPRRLGRTIRQGRYSIRLDHDFAGVISACGKGRTAQGEETWITEDMRTAYIRLHELGFAHSVECWQDEMLIGGLYGIRLDKVFFGESMFTRQTNGSKLAFVALVNHLSQLGVELIDCQMTTDHLLRFGARELDGDTFHDQLARLIQTTSPDGKWNNEHE